jgi:hypothetical protein
MRQIQWSLSFNTTLCLMHCYTIKIHVSWNVTPCILVNVYQIFEARTGSVCAFLDRWNYTGEVQILLLVFATIFVFSLPKYVLRLCLLQRSTAATDANHFYNETASESQPLGWPPVAVRCLNTVMWSNRDCAAVRLRIWTKGTHKHTTGSTNSLMREYIIYSSHIIEHRSKEDIQYWEPLLYT